MKGLTKLCTLRGGKLIVWSLRSIWAYYFVQNITERSKTSILLKLYYCVELPIDCGVESLGPMETPQDTIVAQSMYNHRGCHGSG